MRFLVFQCPLYYPKGGIKDLNNYFYGLQGAKVHVRQLLDALDTFEDGEIQIVDMERDLGEELATIGYFNGRVTGFETKDDFQWNWTILLENYTRITPELSERLGRKKTSDSAP